MNSFELPEKGPSTDISRRLFTTKLGASLAAPALILPGPAEATIEEKKRQILRTQIAFSILRRRVAVRHLLFRTATDLVMGLALGGTHEERDESRVQLGGFLSGLQRPTIATMLTQGTLIGSVFLQAQTLYLLANAPEVDQVLLGARVVIAHQNVSWQPGKLQFLNVSGYPQDDQIEQLRQIGEMYLFQQKLALVMIYPVLGQTSAAGF